MNVIKSYPFVVSFVFAIICFIALFPISATPMAYYVLVFVAISVFGFSSVLYRCITKSFTESNLEGLVWFVGISAIPHMLFSLLVYGSWVCLGGSIIIVIGLLLNKNKFVEI